MSEPLPAGIYCRISYLSAAERRQLGEDEHGLGVRRQEADGRELAERRGLEAAKVYVDDDTSAFSGKPRPAYRQLLADLRSGAIRAVIAWHTDRLHRSPAELEEFIEVIERTGARVETVKAGELDLATPSGRLVARLLGASARYESEHKADRVRRKHQELAEQGMPSGGGRPFGYEPDLLRVREDEAKYIREAARRVLAGESLREVVRDWNERLVPTARRQGGWSSAALRNLLITARISGRREYKARPDGRPLSIGVITSIEARWPPIISPADSDRLRAIFGSRLRIGRPPAHLLGGLVVCGYEDCGAKLHWRPRPYPSWVCETRPGQGGCNRIRVAADPVEILVVEALFREIERRRGGLSRHMQQGSDDRRILDEMASIDTKLREWGDAFGSGRLQLSEWEGLRGAYVRRRAELVRELDKIRRSSFLDGVPDPLRPEWPAMADARKRAIVRHFVEAVLVRPATRRLNRFDEDRVSILWRA